MLSCKTGSGSLIKTVVEILRNTMTEVPMRIDRNGLTIRTMDEQQSTMVDMVLRADKFEKFNYEPFAKAKPGPNGPHVTFEINLSLLYNALTSVKKKGSVGFEFMERPPLPAPQVPTLAVTTRNKSDEVHNRTLIQVTLIEIDVHTHLPMGYVNHMNAKSDLFTGFKNLTKLSHSVLVRISRNSILLRTDAGEIAHGDTTEDAVYEEVFASSALGKIVKIKSLDPNFQVHTGPDLPIKICSSIGTLGEFSIYIKSTRVMETELAELADAEYEEED